MERELFANLFIELDGKLINEAIGDQIDSILVDLSLVLPNMFAICFRDDQFSLIDGTTFQVGHSVHISARDQDNKKVSLIKGEITAIEPEFVQKTITHFTVRGYDKSHRLHHGRYSRTFLMQSDKQIAQKIAGEYGLDLKVSQGTLPQHKYVLQNNQTNMEFLQDRASRIGHYVYVDEGKLYLVKEPENSHVVKLEWGNSLLEFQGRLTTAGQVSEMSARGWDPATKKAIIGKKTSYSHDVVKVRDKDGKATTEEAFGEKYRECVVDYAIRTLDEANLQAQSAIDARGHSFFSAEGLCFGNPNIRAGTKIKIEGIGKRFSGEYRVSRAMHFYDNSGYTTKFEISGNHANTLGGLLTYDNSTNVEKNRHSVVVGQVTNLDDPDGLARVKVKYPILLDTIHGSVECESNWARLVSPMAGAQRGIEFIPEINDEVLVVFENDDLNHPYILGTLWNAKDKPPLATKDVVKNGEVNKRIIKSRSGHIITIDDTKGTESISIIDKTGKNSIVIDSKENAIAINSEADIAIEGKKNLTIKGKTILIEATQGGNMDLKAQNVSLEALAQAELKGNSGVNVKSTGNTKIEGTTTSISGSAVTEIKGALVKIN